MASLDASVTLASQPDRCCQPDKPSPLIRKEELMHQQVQNTAYRTG